MDNDDGGLRYWAEVGQWQQEISHRGAERSCAQHEPAQGHDMPNINELMPSKYLKQSDVTPPKIVTIQSLKSENLAREDQPKKVRPILMFEELDKGLVMNKTNLKRCAKACRSDETDDWIGKKIKLYFDEEVEFGGDQVGGIRITSASNVRTARSEQDAIDELNVNDPPF